MDVSSEKTLRFRFWVRQNFEWLMLEVAYHRDMRKYFSNKLIPIWKFDSEEGRANIYEIT